MIAILVTFLILYLNRNLTGNVGMMNNNRLLDGIHTAVRRRLDVLKMKEPQAKQVSGNSRPSSVLVRAWSN
jgi:hypothetical protein